MPPAKLVERRSLRPIGHVGLEASNTHNMIMLALAYAPATPVERMLSAPHKWPHLEGLQTKLLLEFALESLLDRLACLKAATRGNPEYVLAVWRVGFA